ncbi:MAG: lipid-A-disaccharide synthase [Verrucomicrobiota bacterium]|nr:lipid-A-disaccharide synthase [Verrucomicrobiota bacterium]
MNAPFGSLPKPIAAEPDILVIAGEHSGDQQGARLIKKILLLRPNLKIAAFGGPELEKAGAQLVYNLVDHSVIGIWEVLKNYGTFKKIFNQTIDWITLHRPKIVIFIDYPGFNLRVAQRLFDMKISKQAGGTVKLFYYIGPQIWAWKSKRRFSMGKMLDNLAVIFPFEVHCYSDTQLPTRFVGHPFVEEDYTLPVQYDANGVILLLPGSRLQPVSRIFPAMVDAWTLYAKDRPNERAAVLYPSELIRVELERILATRPEAKQRLTLFPIGEQPRTGATSTIEDPNASKRMTYRLKSIKAKAVLTSSGTMSLCCALAGIPGAIAYRAHPITYWLGRRLVKIPHLGIANILLHPRCVYPEFIQNEATPQKLADQLRLVVDIPSQRKESIHVVEQLRAALTASAEHSAPIWIIDILEHRK